MAALLMATLVAAPLAEAKRAGGGKSHGMSRSSSSSQSYTSLTNNHVKQRQHLKQTAPQRSGPGVGSWSLRVCCAAVGAVAANALADDKPHNPTATEQQATDAQAAQAQQQQEKGGIQAGYGYFSLPAMLSFVFRKLGRKKKLAANNPYAPNNGGQNNLAANSTSGQCRQNR